MTPVAPADDHAFAIWLAERAGETLLEVREQGLTGRALKDAGDASAQELIAGLLAENRPADAVLSEEATDDLRRLDADRVWIIDPLDGTREYSELGRTDWAVHVALWERGDLAVGAVAQPALGQTLATGTPPVAPSEPLGTPRLAVSTNGIPPRPSPSHEPPACSRRGRTGRRSDTTNPTCRCPMCWSVDPNLPSESSNWSPVSADRGGETQRVAVTGSAARGRPDGGSAARSPGA